MFMNSKFGLFNPGAACLLLLSIVACSSSDSRDPGTNPTPIAPRVVSASPLNGTTEGIVNGNASADFSQAMDPATLNSSTFTVTSGMEPVEGRVTYSHPTAVFEPTVPLASAGPFTATITRGAKGVSGLALSESHSWTFASRAFTPPTPTVVSTTPLDGASKVSTTAIVSAAFSRDMDAATLTTGTFTLTSGPGATPVPGKVVYTRAVGWDPGMAEFKPLAALAGNTVFTATLTTAARSTFGIPLAANYAWSFTTGDAMLARLLMDFESTGPFVGLARIGISPELPLFSREASGSAPRP